MIARAIDDPVKDKVHAEFLFDLDQFCGFAVGIRIGQDHFFLFASSGNRTSL